MAHLQGWLAGTALCVGLWGMMGCGTPTTVAPTADKPAAEKPIKPTSEPTSAPTSAPGPKPAAPPATAKSAEAQVMEYIRLLTAKLEAKDYKWVYESALPPAEAKALQAAHPLEEFIREFADKQSDQVLLSTLKTVKEEDINFPDKSGDKAVVPWKESWQKHIDLIFLRVDGRWYLGR